MANRASGLFCSISLIFDLVSESCISVAVLACAYHLRNPNVLMVKSAKPRDRSDTPNCLNRSMERRILANRKVRACAVVVDTIF